MFAKEAHAEQVRKYTNEPYITHPMAVAGLVASVTDDQEMIAAAILHDTVEDTDVTIFVVRDIFGDRVASLVSDLTDVSKPDDGNRKTRKAIDRQHTAQASKNAKTIKLADLINNTKNILSFDSKFAAVYMEEKRLLINVLQGGDEKLLALATSMVDSYFASQNS